MGQDVNCVVVLVVVLLLVVERQRDGHDEEGQEDGAEDQDASDVVNHSGNVHQIFFVFF